MKKFFGIVTTITAITFAACTNGNNKTNENNSSANDTTQSSASTSPTEAKPAFAINEIVKSYLHIKNALAMDNGDDAANGGKEMVAAISKFNNASLTDEQKKAYQDVSDDIKEHGEHIGANAGKIEHQREHFDMLSKDVYDLVKAVGSGQTLYYDHCPMYNNNKGADWLSETKEIKNPYLGTKMPTCGSVKEEIKSE